MLRNDYDFGEKILRDLEARRAACKILGVREDASKEELKKAYRQGCLRYHPDRNRQSKSQAEEPAEVTDSFGSKKFLLVKCAYELLAKDIPCEMLQEESRLWREVPDDDNYRLDSLWGHFLWWRDKFFDW